MTKPSGHSGGGSERKEDEYGVDANLTTVDYRGAE